MTLTTKNASENFFAALTEFLQNWREVSVERDDFSDFADEIPNEATIAAMKEADEIIEEVRAGKRKGYRNIDELFETLSK